MKNVNNVEKIMLVKQKETILQVGGEHDNPTHKSEPANHINHHVEHKFKRSIFCNAPVQEHLRKNLEALFRGVLKPPLNEQTNLERLILFVNI